MAVSLLSLLKSSLAHRVRVYSRQELSAALTLLPRAGSSSLSCPRLCTLFRFDLESSILPGLVLNSQPMASASPVLGLQGMQYYTPLTFILPSPPCWSGSQLCIFLCPWQSLWEGRWEMLGLPFKGMLAFICLFDVC